jgi:predicted nucleic acid-binding protein
MAGVLFDTNIMIDWLRSYRRSRPKDEKQKFCSEKAQDLFNNAFQTKTIIYISCHTIKELLQYPDISQEEEARIYSILPASVIVLSTTDKIAKTAGLMARLSHEYRTHHIEDCYIAATAIVHRLPLYTRNPADYQYVSHEDLILKVPYTF